MPRISEFFGFLAALNGGFDAAARREEEVRLDEPFSPEEENRPFREEGDHVVRGRRVISAAAAAGTPYGDTTVRRPRSRAAGAGFRITSPAGTIVDSLRLRNRMGLDMALEALNDGPRTGTVAVGEITSSPPWLRGSNRCGA